MLFVERNGTFDLGADANNPIIRAVGWAQTLQASNNQNQRIASSTAGSPIAVTLLDPQASFANGTKVMIAGHDNEPANSSDANAAWTVASPLNNTFSITGANGINGVVGTGTGYVAQATDATGWTPYIILLPSPDSVVPLALFTTVASGSIANPFLDIYTYSSATILGTFAWLTQTAMRYTISLTHTQTAALYTAAYGQLAGKPTKNPAYGISLFVDAGGETRQMNSFTVPIINATGK